MAVYVSGVFEILLAVAILPPKTRELAGWGLIVLTLAVTPANVHMYLNAGQFPEASETMLAIRLVIQVMLLLLIWWATRTAIPQAPSPAQDQPNGSATG